MREIGGQQSGFDLNLTDSYYGCHDIRFSLHDLNTSVGKWEREIITITIQKCTKITFEKNCRFAQLTPHIFYRIQKTPTLAN